MNRGPSAHQPSALPLGHTGSPSVVRLVRNLIYISYEAGLACWLEHRTRGRKVASSNPGRAARELSFPESTLCADSFGVRSTPMLLQWHIKDPGHSAKSAGGRLYLNTHAPLIRQNRSGLTTPLSGHSMGTYCQGTLGHGRLSSLSHCGLILAYRVELMCASKSRL